MKIKRHFIACLLIGLLISLSHCGQKGPLYLKEKSDTLKEGLSTETETETELK